MRLLALMVLMASCSAHGDEPDNYCNDAEINQQWARLLMKSPDDPMTIRLYALRDGLCSMVDRGQVKVKPAPAVVLCDWFFCFGRGSLEDHGQSPQRRLIA